MIAQIKWKGRDFLVKLHEGIDLSISYKEDYKQVNCFYAPFFSAQPVKSGTFIGSVRAGGPVNFFNSFINFHGGGTHTECVGHISLERESINQIFREFFGMASVVSVYPTKTENGDRVITRQSLELLCPDDVQSEFLIIRTLPNGEEKKSMHYSGTNPCYLEDIAAEWIVSKGFTHLLIDVPSVDREEDGGQLRAHRALWAGDRRFFSTITELIFVPDSIRDGLYFLNLQVASIEMDAVPSRPVLFQLFSGEISS